MNNLLKKMFFVGLVSSSLNTNALEIDISASSQSDKLLIIANYKDNEVKNILKRTLGDIPSLKIESSENKCEDISKNLKTSYFCTNLKVDNGLYIGEFAEKFGDTLANNKKFAIPLLKNSKEEIAFKLSDLIYEGIFNKESFFSSKLAYVQRKNFKNGKKVFNLKISNYRGENATTLLASTQPILSIDWSPDNTKLAYVSYEKVRSSVFIHDLKTGERIRVASFKGINAFPSWSPTGDRLALSLSNDGKSDIYIYELNENKISRITNFKYDSTEPVWISDTEIVFTSNKTGNPYLYKLDLKNKNINELSKNYIYTTSAKPSKDRKNVYSIYSSKGKSGILETNIKTREEKILISDFYAESPSVAKGNNFLIYSTKEKDYSILKVIDKDNKEIFKIQLDKTDLKEPAYSN